MNSLIFNAKRNFTKKVVPPSSEFKSFFRLRLQDRPIKLATKIKETYKTNKTIRKTIYASKYLFAISFLFFIFPGTFIPGQYHAKLMLIEARKSLTRIYSQFTQPNGSGEDYVKIIQFMNWKFHYLRKNGMLSPQILAKDLNELSKLIDELAILGGDSKTESSNTVIYECLSYINKAFLPTLLAHNVAYFQNNKLQQAMLGLIDIISLRYEQEPQEKLLLLKQADSEEFLYREALLTQFVNLCIILLKFSPTKNHKAVYDRFKEVLQKTAPLYDLAESFTTMEGIQLLLQDLNAEETSESAKMQGRPTEETLNLRLASLHTFRVLIQTDDLVAVKLFKLKLLSNLITYTLKDTKALPTEKETKEEIKLITQAFLSNQYREQLVKHSQDFKEERKRLETLATNKKDYQYINDDIRSLLTKALDQKQQ